MRQTNSEKRPSVIELLVMMEMIAQSLPSCSYKRWLIERLAHAMSRYRHFARHRCAVGFEVQQGLQAIRASFDRVEITLLPPLSTWLDYYCDGFGAIS